MASGGLPDLPLLPQHLRRTPLLCRPGLLPRLVEFAQLLKVLARLEFACPSMVPQAPLQAPSCSRFCLKKLRKVPKKPCFRSVWNIFCGVLDKFQIPPLRRRIFVLKPEPVVFAKNAVYIKGFRPTQGQETKIILLFKFFLLGDCRFLDPISTVT